MNSKANRLLKFFSVFLKTVGWLSFGVLLILDFYFSFTIVYELAGLWGCFLGTVFLPVTLAFAPAVGIIALSTWTPAAILYGGGLVGMIFLASADRLALAAKLSESAGPE